TMWQRIKWRLKRGNLDYTKHSPQFIQQNQIYPIDSVKDRPRAHASTIINAGVDSGVQKLYCAWFSGKAEGFLNVAIMFSEITYDISEVNKISDENHQPIDFHYTRPRVIADDPERACGNPVIFLDNNDVLHLWYAAFYAKDDPYGRKDHRKLFYKKSKDHGITWTQPEEFSDRDGLWVRSPLLVLDSGTWLLPINDEVTKVPKYKTKWSSRFVFSHDNGKTWEFSKLYSIKKGMIQPDVIQFEDGSLYCVNRTRTGYIADMRSFDNGRTWTEPKNMELPNPNSCVAITLSETGAIIMIYNPLTIGRGILSAAKSTDKGASWIRLFDLRDEKLREFSYPCVLETKDGLIHCVYTYKRKTISHDIFVL
ncbi:MAG: hypothetical protein GF364_01910, partial [Candidatus Lokiarchaeota archaeon]|nr:hypothetical protein [Candidatus Lokiarchaeota archaeon]